MASDAATPAWRRHPRARLWPGLAVLAAAAALTVGGDLGAVATAGGDQPLGSGLTGPLVAASVILVWLVAGAPFAFVAGQAGLVVGLDGGPTTTPVTQAALVALLVADVAVAHPDGDRLPTAAVATASAAALFAILETTTGTLRAGTVLLVVTALVGYTIHRYERLSLGLVGDPG